MHLLILALVMCLHICPSSNRLKKLCKLSIKFLELDLVQKCFSFSADDSMKQQVLLGPANATRNAYRGGEVIVEGLKYFTLLKYFSLSTMNLRGFRKITCRTRV